MAVYLACLLCLREGGRGRRKEEGGDGKEEGGGRGKREGRKEGKRGGREGEGGDEGGIAP